MEAAFWTLKNELAIGPIYHYTELRIRGYLFVCFLALVMESILEKRLKGVERASSIAKVLKDVSRNKAVKLIFRGTPQVIRKEPDGDAHLAFGAVGSRRPSRILSGYPAKGPNVALRL